MGIEMNLLVYFPAVHTAGKPITKAFQGQRHRTALQLQYTKDGL